MAAVVLDRVSKVYGGDVLAVDDLRLEVAEGELLVLLGPSGCGKTTILRIIAGLEEMSAGQLWLGGELANDMPPQHRNIAMVFQHGALYPHLTVRQNLAFPLKIARTQDKQAVQERVVEVAPRPRQTRSGEHRRATLLLRLDAPHGWAAGREVSVAVDVPHIFFFDAEGRRIDKSPYLG